MIIRTAIDEEKEFGATVIGDDTDLLVLWIVHAPTNNQLKMVIPKKDRYKAVQSSVQSLFREEIRELHQIKEKIVLTKPSKRNPSAIIFNIPKSFTETSIQQGLRQIFPQDLKVKFIFKGRDTDVQNWVFEVPAQHFHLLKDSQRVPINWTPFKISQFIHYKRSNNCQSFGHLSRDCFFSAPNCAYCGGHHETSLCNAERPSCITRYHHNIRFGTIMQLNHSSRDRSCPCLQTVKQNYLKSIDYT
ncbi:hypothetical protein AVEN_193969-1 [Araneus ventricosus]|uniref:Pre-C2HC domain-containing protein n=1 Tax=Araneus ventricosus TaxID=182803 RepID=A0A4Y2SJS0_ARAVE|nr:hypothetical protein AVEN_193969-1 [Araneus ventricosus]